MSGLHHCGAVGLPRAAQPGEQVVAPYDTAPGARLGWEIDDFADELAALFGQPVDLVSRRAINPRLRRKILHDARPLYAA